MRAAGPRHPTLASPAGPFGAERALCALTATLTAPSNHSQEAAQAALTEARAHSPVRATAKGTASSLRSVAPDETAWRSGRSPRQDCSFVAQTAVSPILPLFARTSSRAGVAVSGVKRQSPDCDQWPRSEDWTSLGPVLLRGRDEHAAPDSTDLRVASATPGPALLETRLQIANWPERLHQARA
jgi:hypothetical protein